MLGVNLNVNLSEEQMDHIASLAADKIDYTFKRLKINDNWYEDRIKRLELEVTQRDRIIIDKEL